MASRAILLVLLLLVASSVLSHMQTTYLNQTVNSPTSSVPALLEKTSYHDKHPANPASYYNTYDSYNGCLINECCYKLLSKVKTGCLAVVPVVSSFLTYWFAAFLLKLSGLCSSYVTANITATATGVTTATDTAIDTATVALTVTTDTTLTVYGVTLVTVTNTETSSIIVSPTETVTTTVTVSTVNVSTETTEYSRNCNTARRRGFFPRVLNIEASTAIEKHETQKVRDDNAPHLKMNLPTDIAHSLPQVQPSFHSVL